MKIGISGLRIYSIIGVYPEERHKVRELWLDIELELFSPPNEDSIESTLNYEKIADLCRAISAESECMLIETLAKKIIDGCFDAFAISGASICISKPSALDDASFAYVKISRKNR